ncbi:hypothetical protein, partial [Nonlabens ulvanivorans]|uniref:hypothetical protein n=1 Tax=Nonlabens ulvanivorans TaxID=906888 RepID=UPI00329892BB
GEKIYYSVLLEAASNSNERLTVSLENTSFSNFKCYRVLPVSDWYSEANKHKVSLEFIPDALFALKRLTDNRFSFDIEQGEKVQLFMEMEGISAGKHNVDIKLSSLKNNGVYNLSFPVEVVKDNSSDFKTNSIIFNNINLQSGKYVVDTWKEVGFTHLQVNYIPTVYFNSNGDPQSSIISNSSNSTGFRNTAYPWLKDGGSILLFWESNYDKVALLKDGGYLKPFTAPWYKAYKFILEEQFRLLKELYPHVSKDNIIVYVADELKSVDIENKKFTVNQLRDFSVFLEDELSEFKTLVTYGYQSDVASVDLLTGIDIKVPHVNLPVSNILLNKTIKPTDIYKELNIENKWMYSVERGRFSSLESFRFNPMIAVAHGYKGYSWYAFTDHAGSTWYATDLNRLDYSMFYHSEPNNPIYSYWSSRMGTNEYLTSSLRLKSIEKGLLNASILENILSKKDSLSKNQRYRLDEILQILLEYNVTYTEKPSFSEAYHNKCKEIEISLRLLQSELN